MMKDCKNYLFFDCECANCFDGIGKMCSFGYVLTDDEFNVIETKDLVMNPETDFDWYLFSPKNTCQLAYSKDYFRANPNFDHYYKRIRELLTAANTVIFGFAVANDVGFVNNACERYYQNLIQFKAFDMAKALEKYYGSPKKLAEWAAFLECDLSQIKTHKSQDDAMMTMFTLRELCAKQNVSVDDLISQNKDFFASSEIEAQRAEERRYRKEVMEKIKYYYNKKSRAPLNKKWAGKNFELQKSCYTDIDRAFNIVKRLYDGGAMVFERVKGKGCVVIPEENLTPELKAKFESLGKEIVFAEEVEKIRT
ncbi:MAG: hypothetical protein MJ169_01220 [Treponema sp.]|nr:hypothetical protein [Treponema sp.]